MNKYLNYNLLSNSVFVDPRIRKNAGWIENYGSGIVRIINYFKEANSPLPTFENNSSGFLVTAFAANNEDSIGNVVNKVTDKVTDKVADKVTDNQNKI